MRIEKIEETIKQFIKELNEFTEIDFNIEHNTVAIRYESHNEARVSCSFDVKRKEKRYVECPFEFATYCGNLGLKFGKNQSLLYHKFINCWIVSTFDNTIKTKICKTPTPLDKLEVGKWYFCTDGEIEDVDVNIKNKFNLYLSYNKYLYVSNDGSVILSDTYYCNWHEVVEDEY